VRDDFRILYLRRGQKSAYDCTRGVSRTRPARCPVIPVNVEQLFIWLGACRPEDDAWRSSNRTSLLQQVNRPPTPRSNAPAWEHINTLQAQLTKTKLVREIAIASSSGRQARTQLKQLLNRSQESPDIEPADLLETPLVQSYADLLAARKYRIRKSLAHRR